MEHHEPHNSVATTEAEPDPALLQHIESLGLKTTEEYVAWCVRHGFSPRTKKHWRERLKERAFVNRHVVDARLAQRKLETRKPEKIIECIFRGDLQEDDVLQPAFKEVCRAYQSSKSCAQTQQAFHRLSQHVVKHAADLMDSQPVIPQYGQQDGNTFIGGLLALARQSREWLRLVTTWKPNTHNPRRQFSSLVRHLLAEWPVPSFMDSVWFKRPSDEAAYQQLWFIGIGLGWNIRIFALPLPYTKKMAHYFMQAPADFTVEAALRWGQIHALGGNARLVRTILGTRLGTTFEHEDFWTTVLQFFINHPMLDHFRIGPIIDFIHYQRFVPQEVFIAPGVVERREPPQPNFTMKGRTPESLVRQVADWHRGLAHVKQPPTEWPASGVAGFECLDRSSGNVRVWTITELTSTRALTAEGREMTHCVATYAHSCLAGASSIWSLEVDYGARRSKVFTIEVNLASRTICQVRGKRNAMPGEKHLSLLRQWAEQAGLRMADQL